MTTFQKYQVKKLNLYSILVDRKFEIAEVQRQGSGTFSSNITIISRAV